MKSTIFLILLLFGTTYVSAQKTYSSDLMVMMAIVDGKEEVIGQSDKTNYLKINKDESMYSLVTEEKTYDFLIIKKETEGVETRYYIKAGDGTLSLLIFNSAKNRANWIFTDKGENFVIYYAKLKEI